MGLKNNAKVHFNVGCILFLDANKAYLFDNSVLGIVFFFKKKKTASYKNLESISYDMCLASCCKRFILLL